MHRAPAVSFSVGRSRWHLGCVGLLGVTAWITALVFVLTASHRDWRCAAILGAALLAPMLTVRGWQRSPSGQLHWDGQQWHWSGFSTTQACRLSLLLDLQRVMLVRLAGESQPPVWLWLEAAPGNVQWMPLRRAIVSSLNDGIGHVTADTGELA